MHIAQRGKIDLSIGAALREKSATPLTATATEAKKQRDTIISEDALFEKWVRFPSKIRELTSLHFIFTKAPQWDAEKQTVTIVLPGKLAADEIEEVLPRLTTYLRESLDNDSVKIETVINEGAQNSSDMTPKGKAQAMAKKNEKLRDLCRRLHLDFA